MFMKVEHRNTILSINVYVFLKFWLITMDIRIYGLFKNLSHSSHECNCYFLFFSKKYKYSSLQFSMIKNFMIIIDLANQSI